MTASTFPFIQFESPLTAEHLAAVERYKHLFYRSPEIIGCI